jgi:hypothetical protein
MAHPKDNCFVYFKGRVWSEYNGDKIEKKIQTPKWKEITRENYMNYQSNLSVTAKKNNAFCVITGKMSGITVFDFDDKEKYDLIYKKHKKEIDTFYTVKTRKGFHHYFKYNEKYENVADSEITHIDIRNDGGMILAPPTSYLSPDKKETFTYEYMGGTLQDVPEWMDEYLIPKHFKSTPEQPKLKIKVKKERKVSTTSEISEASTTDSGTFSSTENVSNNRRKLERIRTAIQEGKLDDKVNNYDDWCAVGMIISHTAGQELNHEGIALFDEFSRRTDKKKFLERTEEENKAQYNSFRNTHLKPITYATFKKWEKEWLKSDPSVKIAEGDDDAGEMAYEMLAHRLKYCCGGLFYKQENLWIASLDDIKSSIQTFLMYKSKIYKEDAKGNITRFVQNLKPAKSIAEVVMNLAKENPEPEFYDKFHSSTRGKLCFKNGVLDFTHRRFTKWEDIKPEDEVFSTTFINRNYNPIKNKAIMEEVVERIFKPLFSDDYQTAINMLSRMIAGHVEDKIWALYIGNRNCGKGVLEAYFRSTFQDYITAISSDLFISKGNREGITDVKDMGWLMDCEMKRIAFMSESLEKVVSDGNKYKAFMSGGDWKKGRRMRENPRDFKIQASIFDARNGAINIAPKDALETCVQFTSVKMFKSQEYIDAKIQQGASEKELELYMLGDPSIKTIKIHTDEWIDALIHILLDGYSDKAVQASQQVKDEEEVENNYISEFLKNFKITNNPSDMVATSVLRDWCEDKEINYKHKIIPLLKGWKCDLHKKVGIIHYKGIVALEPVTNTMMC